MLWQSLGTPWEELNIHHCGWWIDRTPENIAKIISDILIMQPEELIDMGRNGSELIKSNYTADKVALKMKWLYEWILNGGEEPEFVYE